MIARAAYSTRLGNVPRLSFFLQNSNLNLRVEKNLFSNQFFATKSACGKIQETKISRCNKKLSINEKKSSDNNLSNNLHGHVPFAIKPRSTRTGIKKTGDGPQQSLLSSFVQLTKPNLTVLVTLSSICSYAISPHTANLSNLCLLTLGTALCSGSANAINMAREPEFDRKMVRTSNRPIVRGLLTSQAAYWFALATGATGFITLYYGVNPTVASLGLSNILLYGWIYTSLKRKSIINTWIGAIVGAIPPLMGWAASSSLQHPGAWCLAALLYAWQFPHFNALSHNIASQYKLAGYVMTAAENPKLNARVSLRYSLLMFPICFGLSYFEVTDWIFPFDSFLANAWLSLLSYKFWKQQSINYSVHGATKQGIEAASVAARKLFWCSVWHLPAVLVLAMLHKKGQWDRLLLALGFKNKQESLADV